MPPAACGGVGEAECNPVVQSPHGGNVYSDTVKKRLYIIGELSDTGEGAIFV